MEVLRTLTYRQGGRYEKICVMMTMICSIFSFLQIILGRKNQGTAVRECIIK